MRRYVDLITSVMDLVGLLFMSCNLIFIPKPVKFTFNQEYGIITSLQPVADAINAISRDIAPLKWMWLGFIILSISAILKLIKHVKHKNTTPIATKEVIMESVNGTYFYDEDGKRLGSDINVIPIPLYKGMEITIHGYEGIFEVVDWKYHHGHPDEEAGLRIILKKKYEYL